jgi:hypothetical protein
MRAKLFILLSTLTAALLCCCACGTTSVDQVATETAIAGKIYATLTASAPTITPEPTITPPPPPTITPASSPTPMPQAQVQSGALNLREGPGVGFPGIQMLKGGDSVTVLGQLNNCDWLKVHTAGGKEGWLKGGPGFIKLPVACDGLPHGTFRPLNGALVLDQRTLRGLGRLTVDNGTSSDGLVVLVDEGGKTVLAFYVRSMEKFTLNALANGSYQLYFNRGSEWDGDEKKFLKSDEIKKMDQALVFRANGNQYTTWTITLQPVVGGSASASDIPADQFPAIK